MSCQCTVPIADKRQNLAICQRLTLNMGGNDTGREPEKQISIGLRVGHRIAPTLFMMMARQPYADRRAIMVRLKKYGRKEWVSFLPGLHRLV